MNFKEELKWANVPIREVNWKKIPKTYYNPLECIDLVNEILEWLENNLTKQLVRTPSGGIAKCFQNSKDCWDVKADKWGLEIIIHLHKCGWSRIVFRSIQLDDKQELGLGRKGYLRLLKEVPEIAQWAGMDEEENEKIRIEAQHFYKEAYVGDSSFLGIPWGALYLKGQNLNDVWSLDLHKAFPTALAEIIGTDNAQNYLKKVKEGEISKEEAVSAIGYMCSEYCIINGKKRALSKLRYEILDKVCGRICRLGHMLEDQGAELINFRTDSIKFRWPYKRKAPVLDGENLLWDYEFRGCKYQQFSTGKYQYMDEENNHHVVLNGKCKLDAIESDRSKWKWEQLADIEGTKVLGWRYDEKINRVVAGQVDVDNRFSIGGSHNGKIRH